MSRIASWIAFGGLWFCTLVVIGFIARLTFEVMKLGWGIWP